MDDAERSRLESARVGRLATADADARPHAVPVCFALVGDDGDWIATAIDEKPKSAAASDLRRVRDVRENPRVALVVDRYAEDWADLWWVQIRGNATVLDPGDDAHRQGIQALREKYDQYEGHDLESRPAIRIDPGHVVSWDADRER